MKKLSVLALVLAIATLPGCREKRKDVSVKPIRKTTDRYVQTYMDTADDSEIKEIEIDDLNSNEEDLDEDDLDEDDLDIDALLEGYPENANFDDEDLLLDESDETAFNWVDEQADDELRKLYFGFNHYGIKADQKDALAYDIEQVKQLISQAGNALPTVVIEGHACQEGSPSYNIGLSEKRAKSVADLFVAAGVDKELIKVIGRGQECPMVVNGQVINGSRDDRAPNRRVEVRVIYT